MRLYLGGKMRGEPEFGHPMFDLAAGQLRRLGHEIFNPAAHDRKIGFEVKDKAGTVEELREQGVSTRDFLLADMDWILHNSEGMVCLPNWRQSLGTRAEITLHHAIGIPVWNIQEFINDGIEADQILPEHMHAEDNKSPRAQMLDNAKKLITGDRNNSYGPPTQDFDRTAGALNAYGYRGPGDRPLKPHDVAIIIMSVKMSRLVWTHDHKDSWEDIAGYSACGYECTLNEVGSNAV